MKLGSNGIYSVEIDRSSKWSSVGTIYKKSQEIISWDFLFPLFL